MLYICTYMIFKFIYARFSFYSINKSCISTCSKNTINDFHNSVFLTCFLSFLLSFFFFSNSGLPYNEFPILQIKYFYCLQIVSVFYKCFQMLCWKRFSNALKMFFKWIVNEWIVSNCFQMLFKYVHIFKCFFYLFQIISNRFSFHMLLNVFLLYKLKFSNFFQIFFKKFLIFFILI